MIIGILQDRVEKIVHATGSTPKILEVTPEELRALLLSVGRDCDMPQPPVKRRATGYSSGLFSSASHEETEWDHHAPAYLEALSAWKERQKQPKILRLSTPYGPVEIKLKGEG